MECLSRRSVVSRKPFSGEIQPERYSIAKVEPSQSTQSIDLSLFNLSPSPEVKLATTTNGWRPKECYCKLSEDTRLMRKVSNVDPVRVRENVLLFCAGIYAIKALCVCAAQFVLRPRLNLAHVHGLSIILFFATGHRISKKHFWLHKTRQMFAQFCVVVVVRWVGDVRK